MSSPRARECLFVQGTLKRGCANPWSRRLWPQAAFAGEATLPGRLYDLGLYPAFVEEDSSGMLVHGEVAEMGNPAILAQPDHYEGSRYSRVLRRVRMRDGLERGAWVYVCRAPLHHARCLTGGRRPLE